MNAINIHPYDETALLHLQYLVMLLCTFEKKIFETVLLHLTPELAFLPVCRVCTDGLLAATQ